MSDRRKTVASDLIWCELLASGHDQIASGYYYNPYRIKNLLATLLIEAIAWAIVRSRPPS